MTPSDQTAIIVAIAGLAWAVFVLWYMGRTR